MYKFKHGFDKMANMVKAKEMFEALPSKMDWTTSLEAGFDFNRGAKSFDLCVRVTFKTRNALMWYTSEPVHTEIQKFLEEVTTASQVVDYEVDDEDACKIPARPV
jgi:hypothetical protein